MRDTLKLLSIRALGIYTIMKLVQGIKRSDIMRNHNIGALALTKGYDELCEKGLVRRNRDGYVVIEPNGQHKIPTKQPAKTPVAAALAHEVPPTTNQQTKDTKPRKLPYNTRIKNSKAFYEEELIPIEDLEDSIHKQYRGLIRFILGNNDSEEQLDCILQLPEQVSFKQFCRLSNKADKKDKDLKIIMEGIISKPKYTNESVDLNLIIHNWLNKESWDKKQN